MHQISIEFGMSCSLQPKDVSVSRECEITCSALKLVLQRPCDVGGVCVAVRAAQAETEMGRNGNRAPLHVEAGAEHAASGSGAGAGAGCGVGGWSLSLGAYELVDQGDLGGPSDGKPTVVAYAVELGLQIVSRGQSSVV